MGIKLHPCGACARHIRTDEAACPFCGAPVPEGFGPAARPKFSPPVSRAALLFVGAAAATGCGGSTSGSPPGDSGSADVTQDVAQDAPTDSSTPISEAGDDAADTGQPVALYGPGPVPDAGPPPDSSTEDTGGPVVLYGPAPIPDSGDG
jgi:hypothetical protein